MQALTGGCLCGAVRYECGPLQCPPTLCHCRSCQRGSGAPAVAWLTVQAAALHFAGTPVREYGSSPGVWRGFCAACGTPLTYRNAARPGEVDVTVCSLDDAASVAPVDHIWMQDALAWDRPGDGLAQHAGLRDDSGVA